MRGPRGEQTPGAIVLRFVPGEEPISRETVAAVLTAALVEAGAMALPIEVQLVTSVEKTPLGKTLLIKALREKPEPSLLMSGLGARRSR